MILYQIINNEYYFGVHKKENGELRLHRIDEIKKLPDKAVRFGKTYFFKARDKVMLKYPELADKLSDEEKKDILSFILHSSRKG